jgi:hypothetical protein
LRYFDSLALYQWIFSGTGKSEFVDLMIFARGLCISGILIVWLFVIVFFAGPDKCDFAENDLIAVTDSAVVHS